MSEREVVPTLTGMPLRASLQVMFSGLVVCAALAFCLIAVVFI